MDGVRESGSTFDVSSTSPARFRRFGAAGPIYEVEAVDHDQARIRVVESGEALDYPLTALLSDPQA
nr:DUF5397 family protein [uncultured Brevundimonas sp.]